MKEHRLSEEYTNAFQTFLSHTREKEDLFSALKRHLNHINAQSMLDIGAGNGDLAIPLHKVIRNYVAVEPKPDFAKRLKASGVNVIQSAFPCKLQGAFDVVLASHVVPWGEKESFEFLSCAWSYVKPGGRLFMITYDEEVSDWAELLQASKLPIPRVGQGHFEGYKKLLSSWGKLEIEPITTYVETDSLDEMLAALSFVYADGKSEDAIAFQRSNAVRIRLESHYRVGTRYRFPFTHYFLQVEKPRLLTPLDKGT